MPTGYSSSAAIARIRRHCRRRCCQPPAHMHFFAQHRCVSDSGDSDNRSTFSHFGFRISDLLRKYHRNEMKCKMQMRSVRQTFAFSHFLPLFLYLILYPGQQTDNRTPATYTTITTHRHRCHHIARISYDVCENMHTNTIYIVFVHKYVRQTQRASNRHLYEQTQNALDRVVRRRLYAEVICSWMGQYGLLWCYTGGRYCGFRCTKKCDYSVQEEHTVRWPHTVIHKHRVFVCACKCSIK